MNDRMISIAHFCFLHKACDDGRYWALAKCSDMQDVWNKLPPNWLFWVATRNGVLTDKELRLFAVFCARQVENMLSDKRSKNAVDVAERFANGQATKEELAAAEAAAEAAAKAAAEAARAAARDAAWAAAEAARAAARDAARDAAMDAAEAAAEDAAEDAAEAAEAAAEAARAAARDAARDAAMDAAEAAAEDAAEDAAEAAEAAAEAARAAARDAARDAQAAWLRANTKPNFNEVTE